MAGNVIFLPRTALLRACLEYKNVKIMGKSQKRVTLFLRALENRLVRNACQEFCFFRLEQRDLKKVSSNINRVFIKGTAMNGFISHQVWNGKFFATRDKQPKYKKKNPSKGSGMCKQGS